MKKQNIIIAAIIFIILITVFIFLTFSNNIKDVARIIELKEDANLDILVNLGNYSDKEYSESKLLDVSMQIATKLGLLNEINTEDTYTEYVSESDLHLIINELTDQIIEAPIEIEDFYYLYDSENEYYYYRPASPTYFSIKEIKSLKENNSNYEINCSISKTEDLEETTFDNVRISLTYMPENTLVKYKVNKVKIDN